MSFITNLIDPGHKQRGKGVSAAVDATNAYKGFLDTTKQNPLQPIDPNSDVSYETAGGGYQPTDEKFLTPDQARDAGLQGDSSWKDAGPSAGSNLTFDTGGVADAAKYFKNLSQTGTDAIAESDYQKRAQQAELSRRANSEAALADAAQRGMSGGGGALLAQLANNQGAATDRYHAGLETSATAQARRDAAAKEAGTFAQDAGQDTFAADKAKADAIDQWKQAQNQGEDTWGNQRHGEYYGTQQDNANRSTDAAKYMSDRYNTVNDKNADTANQVMQYNKVTLPQQNWQNQGTATQGYAGAKQTEAGVRSGAANQQNQYGPFGPNGPISVFATPAANAAKAGAFK